MSACSLTSYREEINSNTHGKEDRPMVALVIFGTKSSRKISYVLNVLKADYKVVLPGDIPTFNPTHIILSGGPKHVYEHDYYPLPQWVIDSPCPVLGICYGMQLIAYTFGGAVIRMDQKEEGIVDVTEFTNNHNSPPIQKTYTRWMNRYDQVISVPRIFDVTGVTYKNHIASFTDHKKWWAVQYHPESYKHGDIRMFKRFLQTKSRL